jgi:hypothetical protein
MVRKRMQMFYFLIFIKNLPIRQLINIILSGYFISLNYRLIKAENKLIGLGETPDSRDVEVLFLLILVLFLQSLSFYSFLKETLIEYNHKSLSIFWLIGRLLSLIIGLSFMFTFLYWVVILNYPNSIGNPEILGKGYWQNGFNSFYFSLGNYLGVDSEIIPKGILFKSLRLIQSLTNLLLFVFVIGNFDQIKNAFNSQNKLTK